MLRFTVGRWLVHLGLRVMPPGIARTQLSNLLWTWSLNVHATLAAKRSAAAPDRWETPK